MEIMARNLSYKYKGKNQIHNLSFSFESSKIIGITGQFKTLLLEIIDLQKKFHGDLYIDKKQVNSFNKLILQRQIVLIKQKNMFFMNTVFEEMKLVVEYYHYNSKDLKIRMINSLKLVGLDSNYLNRKISTLSESEKTLVRVACGFLTNPKVILFDDIFSGLDYKSKKILLTLIRKLRDRRDKLIVIASNDVDLLYEYTDKLLVLDNGNCVCLEDTMSVFLNEEFLMQHNLAVPYLVKFTNLARSKNVKLSYHRDILDLIKDVYKHV